MSMVYRRTLLLEGLQDPNFAISKFLQLKFDPQNSLLYNHNMQQKMYYDRNYQYAVRVKQTIMIDKSLGQKFKINSFLCRTPTIPLLTTINVGEIVCWPNAIAHTPKIFLDINWAKNYALLVQKQCDKFRNGYQSILLM